MYEDGEDHRALVKEEEIVSGIGNQRAKIVNKRGIGIQRVREQVCMPTFQMTFTSCGRTGREDQ